MLQKFRFFYWLRSCFFFVELQRRAVPWVLQLRSNGFVQCQDVSLKVCPSCVLSKRVGKPQIRRHVGDWVTTVETQVFLVFFYLLVPCHAKVPK